MISEMITAERMTGELRTSPGSERSRTRGPVLRENSP
jgi:hypothetical protein